MNSQKEYEKLHKVSRQASVLEGINSLLSWDQETMMPEGASAARSEQMEAMARLVHRERTSKKFLNALAKLIDIDSGKPKVDDLDPSQLAALKRWRRDYQVQTALPTSFITKFALATAQGVDVWKEARKNNDFSLFQPWLEKIVSLCRKKADYLDYKDHPYDALLDLHESELKTEEVSRLFDQTKSAVRDLINKTCSSPQIDDSVLYGKFPQEKQMAFGRLLLEDIGYTNRHGRIDISAHPFSTSSHPTDSRITTRIHPDKLMSNILTLLHEGGHSLYEMGLPSDHFGSPLGEAISYGIHESQSRWWETRIGLSKPYWSYYLPLLKKHFQQELADISLDDFWRAINKVEPSLIRVEADEATYPLHVILRFELEKGLIGGTIKVKELPDLWRSLSRELLGVASVKDSDGCLQDVHWSCGGIGYFPTYTLGNMYAAQLFDTFAKECPEWSDRLESGNLLFVREWLEKSVWRHGRRYNGNELMEKVTGSRLQAEPYINYLTGKYSAVYALKKET